MKGFRHYSTILFFCVFIIACQNQDKTSSCTNSNTECYITEFLKTLKKDTATSDSIKNIIKELVTDSMRWWGIDYLTNNMDSVKKSNERYLNHIHLAHSWNKEHQNNPFVNGRIWNQKGLYYAYTYRYDSAFYCFKQALNTFTQLKSFEELSATTMNLAGIYYRTGYITTAAEHYKRASLLADSLDNTQNCISSHIALAQIYADLKNFKLAQQHLDEAESMIDEANLYELYFYNFARGICYYYQKENAKAYASFNVAMSHASKLGIFQQTMCQATLAEAALLNNNNALAMSHINPCLETLKKYPHTLFPTVRFYICSIAADVYFAQGNTKMAKSILAQIPKDEEVVMLRYLSLHYNRMSIHAEKSGDFEKAFNYQKIANRYQNQINNENAINNIIEIGQRYQRDTTSLRQNMAIAKIENKMSHDQLRLITIIAGLLLIISIFIVAFVMIRRRNDQRYHEQFKQISKLRMDVVRNRISPHYIFNVLGLMLPKFKSNPELHEMSDLFIDVIRGNLLASNELSIKFTDECHLVKQYIRLYEKVKGTYPVVSWHDESHGEADQVMVPTMCLQIPVENALKHAFTEVEEHCSIDIYIQVEHQRLILRIIDNGDGYNPGRVISTGRDTGTGLRVLSRTISLFNKHNSNPIGFYIKNLTSEKNKGTEVKISIPFEYDYSE